MKLKLVSIILSIASVTATPVVANDTSPLAFEFKKIADLPDFPRVVSDGNYVIGFVDPNSTWPDVPEFTTRAMYRWSEAKGVEWLIDETIKQSHPRDVNNNGSATARVCSAHDCYSVIWHQNGSIQSLKAEIDEPITEFLEINELGYNPVQEEIHISEKEALAGTTVYTTMSGMRGTLAWTWDKKAKLKILEQGTENTQSEAQGINNPGIVVGSTIESSSGVETATYWDKNGKKQIINLSSADYPAGTLALGLNNSGLVAGVDSFTYGNPWRFDINDQKRLPMENSPLGDARPTAVLQNDFIAGSVESVGESGLFLRPTLWDSKGRIYDLNDSFEDDKYELMGWYGINTSLLMATPLRSKETDYYDGAALYQLIVVTPES